MEVEGQSGGEKQDRRYPIEEYFVHRDSIEKVRFLFDGIKTFSGSVRTAADVFSSNLLAVYVTASAVPVFASQTSRQGTELIMLGVAVATDKAVRSGEQDAERRDRVLKSLQMDASSPPWKGRADELAKKMAEDNLAGFLQHEFSRDAALQILRQCTVLTWSAFEVLASDLFQLLINTRPRLSGLLLKDERTKRLYQSKEFILALEEYDFDLSRSMGEVLLRQRRMDDLDTIRATYDVLFESRESMRTVLSDVGLWRLYKTRNLIVHRAGVVDQLFLTSTGMKAELGSKLTVTPRVLEDFVVLVARVGVELLAAASTVVAAPLPVNPTQTNG
jgi:hypothetical protein